MGLENLARNWRGHQYLKDLPSETVFFLLQARAMKGTDCLLRVDITVMGHQSLSRTCCDHQCLESASKGFGE